jgi:hypothetical protein
MTTPRGAGQRAPESLEPVLAFRATGKVLWFRVHTGGCTLADHFRLHVERKGGCAEVSLLRLIPDTCKGDFPNGTEITFSYESAGLERDEVVRLTNPIL